MSASTPLYDIDALGVQFHVRGGARGAPRTLRALDDISFSLLGGESLGIVGESGSGKSTLLRALLGLVPASSGVVRWRGRPLALLSRDERATWRASVQVVFQDPLASLDPRMRVRDIVAEPLRIHRAALAGATIDRLVGAALERVGLPPDSATRRPHEFSGGQCQRIAIARALVLEPAVLVCDEAVSSLDVSVQAQILALLADIRRERGTALIFVSHNLAVVRQLCDRVLVLYLGRMMECGPVETVLARPAHPYTQRLLEAHPVPDPLVARARLPQESDGEPPSALDPPAGCVFHPRCRKAVPECEAARPVFEAKQTGSRAACLRA
jgi:oligopeptide transport system ATP-binding protein